jgi:hypothetical protein
VVEVVTPDGTTIIRGQRDAAATNPWDEVLQDDTPKVRP